jgi:hypothetical protein
MTGFQRGFGIGGVANRTRLLPNARRQQVLSPAHRPLTARPVSSLPLPGRPDQGLSPPPAEAPRRACLPHRRAGAAGSRAQRRNKKRRTNDGLRPVYGGAERCRACPRLTANQPIPARVWPAADAMSPPPRPVSAASLGPRRGVGLRPVRSRPGAVHPALSLGLKAFAICWARSRI